MMFKSLTIAALAAVAAAAPAAQTPASTCVLACAEVSSACSVAALKEGDVFGQIGCQSAAETCSANCLAGVAVAVADTVDFGTSLGVDFDVSVLSDVQAAGANTFGATLNFDCNNLPAEFSMMSQMMDVSEMTEGLTGMFQVIPGFPADLLAEMVTALGKAATDSRKLCEVMKVGASMATMGGYDGYAADSLATMKAAANSGIFDILLGAATANKVLAYANNAEDLIDAAAKFAEAELAYNVAGCGSSPSSNDFGDAVGNLADGVGADLLDGVGDLLDGAGDLLDGAGDYATCVSDCAVNNLYDAAKQTSCSLNCKRARRDPPPNDFGDFGDFGDLADAVGADLLDGVGGLLDGAGDYAACVTDCTTANLYDAAKQVACSKNCVGQGTVSVSVSGSVSGSGSAPPSNDPCTPLKAALDAATTNQMQVQTATEDAASGATATVASTVAVVVAVAAAFF